MNDIFVRQRRLPLWVKGQVLLDEDGDYNIYLNDAFNFETQKKVLQHELAHVNNRHFHTENSVKHIEDEASKKRS